MNARTPFALNETPPKDGRTSTPVTKSTEEWLEGGEASADPSCGSFYRMAGALRFAARDNGWQAPRREVFFVTDAHADAEAFVASLVAAGAIRKTGAGHRDFRLTKRGRRGVVVIGGDCLDKGPSNIELLRAIAHLRSLGTRLKLLVGNHDLRLYLALRSLEVDRDHSSAHFFVRMGSKGIPLLREVYERYLAQGHPLLNHAPPEDECRRLLFPGDDWAASFDKALGEQLSALAMTKEVSRIAEKQDSFEDACHQHRLTLRDAWASAMLCRSLFLDKNGEFAWFYKTMRLVWRSGSCLFLHAGIDDHLVARLGRGGVREANRWFRDTLKRDPAQCYHGPAGNGLRTKYREVDFPLTEQGIDDFHKLGLHAVVHGHRSTTQGQRLCLRRGVLHVEGDTTLNRHSRRSCGLPGHGTGVTILTTEGQIIGLSADYPRIKVFDPRRYLSDPTVNRTNHGGRAEKLQTRVAAGCG